MFIEIKKEGEARNKNKWRDDLLRAAELLEQKGWCQNMLSTSHGEHCLLGAIYFCHYGVEGDSNHIAPPEWGEVFTLLEKFTGGMQPAFWNDAAGRTRAEVIAVLRAAADSDK